MSTVSDADLLQIELQSELELLQEEEKDSFHRIHDDLSIDDIFSSSDDADYELFELNKDCADSHNYKNENTDIWKSYFDKLSVKDEKYIKESSNALFEMKKECATHNVIISDPLPIEESIPLILDSNEAITENPNIPSHIFSEPLSPKISEKNEYNTELKNLENELNEITRDHEEELKTNCDEKWSTLLFESSDLYNEYMQSTNRLVLMQYFVDWKLEWSQRKEQRQRAKKIKDKMQCIVQRLVNVTIIKYQNRSYKLNKWHVLISHYRHKCAMNQIQCNALWKMHVCDYVIFHFEQTYKAKMECRRRMKSECLPFIFCAFEQFQRRRLCANIISKWYKHQIEKRNLFKIKDGIRKLHIFKAKYFEKPIKKIIFLSWLKHTKSKKCNIECFEIKLNKNKQRVCLIHWQRIKLLNVQRRKIINFVYTKRERMRYLKLQRQRKEDALCIIQSYFRMFHVRSIMNSVQNKLSLIDEMFSNDIKCADQNEFEPFTELNECEFMFDESIIDFNLKPLSNPPSPVCSKVAESESCDESEESELQSLSQSTQESSSTSSSDESAMSDSESEIMSENEKEYEGIHQNDNKKSTKVHQKNNECDEWQFENENVAESWLKRKKKFRSKRKKKSTAKSRLNRFNRMKNQKKHSFGGNSKRFKNKKKSESKKQNKPKFVKFGCPTNPKQ